MLIQVSNVKKLYAYAKRYKNFLKKLELKNVIK